MNEKLYTDEDLKVAEDSLFGITAILTSAVREDAVKAILDAVAPAIAARALREAADSIDLHGTAATNASSVRHWLRGLSLVIEGGR